jgi:dTMP kinase
LFIVFEGPEGSGKSTQAKLLAASLQANDRRVVLTREPGGTQLGERLRAMLLDPHVDAISPLTEALLYTAARAEHVERVIRPALAAGETVVCDRLFDSTLAYQGGGRGLDLAQLKSVQIFATGGLEPDLRVLLDLPVEIGLARRYADAETVNRLDGESVAFHQRVRETYLSTAEAAPGAWLIVDGEQRPAQIAAEILAAVQERFA